MFRLPSGLYFSACLDILFVSILCTCCSHFFRYCFISFTTFCAPVFPLIQSFFSFRRIFKYQFSQKSAKWGPSSSLRTDGRIDMTKLISFFEILRTLLKTGTDDIVTHVTVTDDTVTDDTVTDNTVMDVITVHFKNYTKHRNTFCGKVLKYKLYLHSFLKSALFTIRFRQQTVCRQSSNLACYNVTF